MKKETFLSARRILNLPRKTITGNEFEGTANKSEGIKLLINETGKVLPTFTVYQLKMFRVLKYKSKIEFYYQRRKLS